jgi:4,5-dihydroxyphthalate decarboxylase
MKLLIGRDDLTAAATEAGRRADPSIEVESLSIRPVHNASKPFVNESAIDVCELAIVTMLQAIAFDKPVALLPVTTLGRFQHQTLVTVKELTVADIAGMTVGVRSWSQTTGVWVRGFLTSQFGADLRAIDWVVYEDGHIGEYVDPSWVRRARTGSRLPADFLDGRVDFAILGNELPDDPRAHTAIPAADAAGAEWSAQRGYAPINHVVGVSLVAAREHADAILAMYDAMSATLRGGRNGSGVVMEPCGFEELRGPFSQAAAFALEQDVLPRAVDFDEVVAQTCDALGVPVSRLGG